MDTFLHLFTALRGTVSSAATTNQTRATSIENGVKRLIGVSDEGFAILVSAIEKAETDHGRQLYLEREAASHATNLDSDLHALDEKRRLSLRSAYFQLQQTLTPADWSALQLFLKNEVASQIRTGVAANALRH